MVNKSTAGINEIATNIVNLDGMINSQAASITEASAAIEQMIHNIGSISGSTKPIEKIVARSQVLLEVNKTIAKIAPMTNL